MAARGLRELRYSQIATGDRTLQAIEDMGSVVFRHVTDAMSRLPMETPDGSVAWIDLRSASADIYVAARSAAALEQGFEAIAGALEVGRVVDERVPVTFWASDGGRYVSSAHRLIAAPTWEEVRPNHASTTVEALEPLMSAGPPDGDGRLVLWHGRAGTGKTHALRALVRSWRERCLPHFIADPDAFLGTNAQYLMDVLTRSDPERGSDREWRLVILEDAGELVAADARGRMGQALSRLLNVTDGLIGLGMNAVVLITTNEPLQKLHPAVTRRGRCWAATEFRPLPVDEANAWLARAGCERRVVAATVIAELYAVLRGHEPRMQPSFGFAAACR